VLLLTGTVALTPCYPCQRCFSVLMGWIRWQPASMYSTPKVVSLALHDSPKHD
jgi:hypothetical protein